MHTAVHTYLMSLILSVTASIVLQSEHPTTSVRQKCRAEEPLTLQHACVGGRSIA